MNQYKTYFEKQVEKFKKQNEKQKPKIELLPVRPVWVDEDIINRQQLMLMIGKQEGCQAIITSRNQPNKLQR